MALLPDLSSAQRLAVAEVTGTIERIGVGRDRQLNVDQGVDELHAITRDPVVLGSVLGAYVVKAEDVPAYQRAVELLRAAGADEDAAAVKTAWLRERRRLHGGLLP